jgi:hypothetical protein
MGRLFHLSISTFTLFDKPLRTRGLVPTSGPTASDQRGRFSLPGSRLISAIQISRG